jgi:hypothetical protein
LRILRDASIDEIETHLLALGGGNHEQDMEAVHLASSRALAECERASPSVGLGPLLIRDSRRRERIHGPWFLQDGSHRALGLAMTFVSGQLKGGRIKTFVVSRRPLVVKQV